MIPMLRSSYKEKGNKLLSMSSVYKERNNGTTLQQEKFI